MNYVKAFLIMLAIVGAFVGGLWLTILWSNFVISLKLPDWQGYPLVLAPIVVPYIVWMTLVIGSAFGRKP